MIKKIIVASLITCLACLISFGIGLQIKQPKTEEVAKQAVKSLATEEIQQWTYEQRIENARALGEAELSQLKQQQISELCANFIQQATTTKK